MITSLSDDPVLEDCEAEDPDNVYLPSPERIQRICAEYQQGWTDREQLKRSNTKPHRWSVSEVHFSLETSSIPDD